MIHLLGGPFVVLMSMTTPDDSVCVCVYVGVEEGSRRKRRGQPSGTASACRQSGGCDTTVFKNTGDVFQVGANAFTESLEMRTLKDKKCQKSSNLKKSKETKNP